MDHSDWIYDSGWVHQEHYASTMNNVVLPFLKNLRREAWVNGEGGRPLYTVRYDAQLPRGTVLIVHGFTECVEKYAEVIYALLSQGYSVLCYDQRGHGRSWRAEDLSDPSATHVDRFDEYVEDLKCVRRERLKDMPHPWVLLAHSMGGAVAAFCLEREPGSFEKAVLSSPMIAPNRGGLPYLGALALCWVQMALGHGKQRILGTKPYDAPEKFETSCASGRERFDWYEEIRARTPRMQNNAPTYGWTLEAVSVTRKLLAPGAVERIQCPVRLYQAETDSSVLPSAQRMFIRRVKNGSLQKVPGSRHEIYRSPDAVVLPWWQDVIAFLNEKKKTLRTADDE